jgi:hypothetical protein
MRIHYAMSCAIIIAVASCQRSTPSAAPATSPATAAAPVPAATPTPLVAPQPATPPSALEAPSAERWCAAVIATNTRFGTMVDHQFRVPIPIGSMRAVMSYSLAHRDEYLAGTPAEIHDEVAQQIAYFERVMATPQPNASAIPSPSERAAFERLAQYQEQHCGIRLGGGSN